MTITWRASLAAAAAALLLPIAGCSPGDAKFRSTDITGADFGKSLSLIGHDGKVRRLEDFRGKAVILFFGFTHCPDICPTTLAEVAGALKQLGADASRVQVLFVTVDPERDTAEVLRNYVTAFDPAFLGLRGDAESTQRVAKEFRIFFEKRQGKAPGAYSVDHSGQSYVLDGQGRLRLLVRHDRIGQDLAHDLKILLGQRA